MQQEFKVIGLRDEIYQGETVSGHNCDFEYSTEDKVRHVLLLRGCNDQRNYELSLWEEEGECGSGWCTASFGYAEMKVVKRFAGKTHKVIGEHIVTFDQGSFDIENDVYSYSDDGGDGYYPSGYVSINYSLFEKIEGRGFGKRPVLIFYGDSNAMKSHVASLTGKTVFETDYELGKGNLPEFITEDIVVVGNKYSVDLEDIKARLTTCQVIEVKFTKV